MVIDPEHRPSSLGSPKVHIFLTTILFYLHFYISREVEDLRNVEVSAWENLFFMTLSAHWPSCKHVIWGRADGRKRKLEGVGLLKWESRNHIFK